MDYYHVILWHAGVTAWHVTSTDGLIFRINMGQGIDIKNLSSRSVLTVKNMTQDRYGNYTCVAANRLGTANASVPLIRK